MPMLVRFTDTTTQTTTKAATGEDRVFMHIQYMLAWLCV